ncbi:hypothetical protein TanjilG_12202 [Lupinus angustifolius]|uniref:Uncharacterized protein n=1 Tax=Lupinus angustifolius TaxID=3871 RepID=A0A1J7IFT5_LUPAN|nr:hypothetical protein TanjilG_12202 [Lupinus angustifolius]
MDLTLRVVVESVINGSNTLWFPLKRLRRLQSGMLVTWKYIQGRCSITSLVPIGISDSGTTTVKVEDLQVGLTVNLKNQEGTLELILLDY